MLSLEGFGSGMLEHDWKVVQLLFARTWSEMTVTAGVFGFRWEPWNWLRPLMLDFESLRRTKAMGLAQHSDGCLKLSESIRHVPSTSIHKNFPGKNRFSCSTSQAIWQRHGLARAMQREEGKPGYVEEKLLCIAISSFLFLLVHFFLVACAEICISCRVFFKLRPIMQVE